MSTRYDKTTEDNNSIISGYEDTNKVYDYVIPSCGIEDLDRAVFELFNKQIPLYYDIQGKVKKVPVIFATGERFAILRRKKPITDKAGALILPLISITRSTLENKPQKGTANNEMFPETFIRRIADNNTEYRQLNNFEGFKRLNHTSNNLESSSSKYSLKPQIKNNIYETIELPPVKYIGASYEITIWSSFTQQMNKILEAIISAYTINPGQQFKIESEKGYWFPAFVESSFSQDTNYADYTDAERYIKYSMTLSATGYILAPNIEGGKVGLKSLVSAPQVSFEILGNPSELDPQFGGGIQSNDPNSRVLDDILDEDLPPVAQRVGIDAIDTLDHLHDEDKSLARVVGQSNLEIYDYVGERSSNAKKQTKHIFKDSNGNTVEIKGTPSPSGETIFDQKYAQTIFNITIKDN
jgi:hypothetical protein